MYERFYGLKLSPFQLSPDPRFFFPTPSHNEALATLKCGVLRRKGFVVVTGEAGTGKTLLLRYLLDSLDRDNTATVFIYNPRLTASDFLAYVLTELRISQPGRTKGEMLSHLNEYLLLRSRRGAATAILVDEAHLLEWDLLEEIRLLSNLENSQNKLVQMVLVGQPELDNKIDSPELHQLKQRISFRSRLKPLTFDELRGYVHRRLELAGANSHASSIFQPEALKLVHDISRGIPRVVNNLCENSLISGYEKQSKQIPKEIVREVAADLHIDQDATVSAFTAEKIWADYRVPAPSNSAGVLKEADEPSV